MWKSILTSAEKWKSKEDKGESVGTHCLFCLRDRKRRSFVCGRKRCRNIWRRVRRYHQRIARDLGADPYILASMERTDQYLDEHYRAGRGLAFVDDDRGPDGKPV